MFGLLRTILAIYVVLIHVFGIPALGNYSVSFFFILSGFLMTYIMHHTYHYSYDGFRNFWKNRFLRLYPAYWFVLIVSLILLYIFPFADRDPAMNIPSGLKEWLPNISIIFPNVVPHRFEPRTLPTCWALTNEIIFYFLISLGISKSFKRTLIWLGISILYFVFTYLYYNLPTFRYSAIPASSLPFAIGASLYWINKKLPAFKPNLLSIIIVFTLFNLNAIYLSNPANVYREISIYLNFVIASVLVILCFHMKPGVRLTKLDTFTGHFSYPFYLSHDLIFYIFMIFQLGQPEDAHKLSLNSILLFFGVLVLFSLVIVIIDLSLSKFKYLPNSVSRFRKVALGKI